MIAAAKPVQKKTLPVSWHEGFLAMVPAIENYAKCAFRHMDAEARAEMIQEVLANCCCAYARLAELSKTSIAYAGPLARFGVAQTREGRRTGSRSNCHDVTSPWCWKKKGIVVERLDQFDGDEECWAEALVEDRTAGPDAIAATRIDFSTWLHSLPRRLRKIALFLATGETTGAAARRFRVSPGRISQIRKGLHETWRTFQGEIPALASA